MSKKNVTNEQCEIGKKRASRAVNVSAASALVLGSTLALVPGAASATNGRDHHSQGQMASYVTGDFPTKGELQWQAEGRLGNSNSNNPLSGDWELGVGNDTQQAGQFSQGQYDFTGEGQQAQDFTVTYDGSGQAVMTMEDGTSTSFDVGEVEENSKLYIVGVNKAGGAESTKLTNLSLNGESIEAKSAQNAENQIVLPGPQVGYIEVSDAELENGFTVAGAAEFSSDTASGSEQALQVQVRSAEQNDEDNGSGGDEDNANGGEAPVDTKAPRAKITSPEQNATLSGMAEIRATVKDKNPDHYFLRITDAEGNKVFAKTYQQEEKLKNEPIHEFDTTEVEDGEYKLFLAARDAEGNKDGDANNDGRSTDSVNVTVNNTQAGNDDNNGDNSNQDGDAGQGNGGDNQDGNNQDNPGQGNPGQDNPGQGNEDEDTNSGGDNGNNDQDQGNNGNRNAFSRVFIQIRGNVQNIFVSVNNFFSFRW